MFVPMTSYIVMTLFLHATSGKMSYASLAWCLRLSCLTYCVRRECASLVESCPSPDFSKRLGFPWCPGLPYFVGHGRWLRWLGGGCLYRDGIGISCLMSAVPLSHGLRQVMCTRMGMCFACQILPITCFSPNFWSLARLTKLNTEMHICRTKFGIVTLLFEWMIRSSPRVSSAQWSTADTDTSVLMSVTEHWFKVNVYTSSIQF